MKRRSNAARVVKKPAPPPPVFGCIVCHYAAGKATFYCPGCGAINCMKAAPEWLAKAFREKPEVFKRQPLRKAPTTSENGMMEPSNDFHLNRDSSDPDDDDRSSRDDDDDDDEEEFPEMGPIVVQKLSKVKSEETIYVPTGDEGFDTVLSGGLPLNNCIALGGQPGIGKSTLVRQVTAHLMQEGYKVMYAAGEEAIGVIKAEYKRQWLLKKYPEAKNIEMCSSVDPDAIVHEAKQRDIDVLIVDSGFVMRSRRVNGPPGKERQVSYACSLFMNAAHATDEFMDTRPMTIVILFHMTKDGDLSGSNFAKHETDGSFSLDSVDPVTLKALDDQNEPSGYVRLRVHGKYRRGKNTAKAYYKMGNRGLQTWKPKKGKSLVVTKGKKKPPRAR